MKTTYPIEDIQPAIRAQRKQIMSRDGFGRSCSLKHVQLRHDCNRLQVDAERPEDFHDRKFMIDQQAQNKCRDQKKLNTESVVIA